MEEKEVRIPIFGVIDEDKPVKFFYCLITIIKGGITPPFFIPQKHNLISFSPHHQSSSAHRKCSDL